MEEREKSGINLIEELERLKRENFELKNLFYSLNCQSAIWDIITDPGISFETTIGRMAGIVSEYWPEGSQPGIVITVRDKNFVSPGFEPGKIRISRQLESGGAIFGKIEIILHSQDSFKADPVLKPAESEMLSAITRILGWFTAKNEKEQTLQEDEKNYISAMKLQDHEFARQNERLNAILVSMPDTVFIHDSDGVCIDYYRTADHKTFVPEKSVIGSKLEDVFNPEDAALFLGKMREAIHTGKTVQHEYEIEIKGRKYYYESNISSLGYDQVLVLSRDITEKKLTDRELKESIRTRDKMFSIISHDLRGPVGSLIPMAELLAGESMNEISKKDIVEGVKKTAVAIYSLLENLLGWAKIQTKTLAIDQINLDINQVIGECVDLVMPFSTLKSISISIQAEKDLWVFADRNSVNLVMRNLLDNAIKFTPIGGIISISARQEAEGVKVEVTDNGAGMDMEFKEKLFGGDFQLFSDNGFEKSTGLGLVLCKEFIEKNGGTIAVESVRGEGTRFIFTLKNGESAEVRKSSLRENMVIEPEKLRGRKILIVEDDPFSQIYEKTLLNRWHALADIAGNGQQAVDLLSVNNYEIVLMDIKMPVMDGFEAISIIRNELKLKIPVFAVSAYVNESIVKKAIASGFDDYMMKPVDPQVLYSKIIQFLKLDFRTSVSQAERANYQYANTNRFTDPEKLKRVFDGDKALITGMIRKFLEITPAYYEEMITAFNKHDMTQLRQAAHKLKASLQLLAGNDLIVSFKQLYEFTADSSDFPKLAPLIGDFRNWYPLLCRELENDLALM